MPEREFELYLSLLSRFLRLRPAQRDEVADELRDHLDQRLEELAAQGMSREEAIHKALEEFGDAAELAKHFTQAAHIRRRRVIMRCTYGTIAALAASLLIATAFWPASPQGQLPSRGEAQDANRAATPAVAAAQTPTVDDARAAVEAKLSQRLDSLNWGEIPLDEALQKLGDEIGVDVVIDYDTMQEEGIAVSQPIRKMAIKHTRLEARAALDLILEPLQLGYFIRDGLLIVTTQNKVGEMIEVQIYDIRDLPTTVAPIVKTSAVPRQTMRGLAAVDSFDGTALLENKQSRPGTVKLPPDVAAAQVLKQGFGGGGAGPDPNTKRSNLATVIMARVMPDSWEDVGGPGGISECTQYDGLLFVTADPIVHGKIKRFLNDLRGVLREGAAAAPGGLGASRSKEKTADR